MRDRVYRHMTALQCQMSKNISHFNTLNGKLENIAYVFAFVFIVTTNSLLLIGVYRSKCPKTFLCKLFIYISIGDICIAFTTIPAHFLNVYFFEDLQSCATLRKIEELSYIFFANVAGLLTLGVSMDRYMFIRYPFHHAKYFSRNRALYSYVAFCYIISVVLTLASVVLTAFYNLIALILMIIILIASIILNIKLVCYIRAQSKEIRRLSNTFVHSMNQRRAAKTLSLLTILLVITFTPLATFLTTVMISSGLYYWETFNYSSMAFFNWARMIIFLNSGCNALIFIFRSREICQYYKRIFFKKGNTT